MNFFLVLFMYAAWSSVFSLGKMALELSPPIFLTGFRMLMGAAILLAYIVIRNRSSFQFSRKQWALLGLLSVFSIYLTNAFEFWGLQSLTAAKTCFIYSLSPFFAALFSYLHFGERMNGRKWLGMCVGFVGFIPLLLTQKGADELLTHVPFVSWPELAMVGASACTAYGWIILRMIISPSKEQKDATPISPMMANGVSMLIGGFLALTHSFMIDSWSPLPVATQSLGPFVQGVLIMAIISNVLCYNLYGYLLKKFTATFLSFMGLFSPIFASLNSWYFLNEQPSLVIFFSTGIVSLGLWLIYSAELRQGYMTRKTA
ncbi:MAG TPA: DMT family transporter [Chlamydiales bacterium]|nr:DMT family transporter [Chlamydiales bacterium]